MKRRENCKGGRPRVKGNEQKRLSNQQLQFEQSWASYEWLIKDKLCKIDENVRNMIREMQTFGVPAELIAEHLPLKFEELKQKVVAENDVHFIPGKSFHGPQKRRVVSGNAHV
jgi:hypothetical protein